VRFLPLMLILEQRTRRIATAKLPPAVESHRGKLALTC